MMQAKDSTQSLAALRVRNTVMKRTTTGSDENGYGEAGSEDKLLLLDRYKTDHHHQDRAHGDQNGNTNVVYDGNRTFADEYQQPNCDGTTDIATSLARKQQQLLQSKAVNKKQQQQQKKKYELTEFHLLPDHIRDNEYILRYYRSNWPIRESLLSIFSIHNETLNLWTHLIGFLLFLALTIDTVRDVPRLEQLFEKASRLQQEMVMDEVVVPILTQRVTRWPFFVFMGGSMFCLLSSSICHLLNGHSSSLTYWLLRLDYTGIGIMIATSFFPPVYYVFLCQPAWRQFYLTSISMIGIGTVIVSLVPVFQTPKYRPVRGLAFASMALSGVIPAAHKFMYFHHEPYCLHTLAYELTMGAFYVAGVIIYIARIPERWWPGLFDLAGHSHQIFHVLVVAGAFTHYKGALLYLEWRDKIGCS